MLRLGSILLCLGVCAGRVLYGANNYTEYRPGTLKLIISAPHGGSLRPDTVKSRGTAGCYDPSYNDCVWSHTCGAPDASKCRAVSEMDANTRDLALEIADAVEAIYGIGNRPHVILNNLHRSKYDANRHVDEATFGDPESKRAFEDYHAFIETSKAAIGYKGLFLDIHGQSVSNNATQVSVLLDANVLNSKKIPDHLFAYTSIKNIFLKSGLSLDQIVRGPQSFSGQLSAAGYKTIPSPSIPGPGVAKWFSGGYNTRRHSGGLIDAIQIESHSSLRLSTAVRRKYAADLAHIIAGHLNTYY